VSDIPLSLSAYYACPGFFADGDAGPPAAGFAVGFVAGNSLSTIMAFVKAERRSFSYQYRFL
jgi:hypothetical protein